MTEIWNLSTLCRCCHSDGCFKRLNRPYQYDDSVEMYDIMLQKTLGIMISQPVNVEASYTICDKCINRLREAAKFKEQVEACEKKFLIYCTNEQFLNSTIDNVKDEVSSEPDNEATHLHYDADDNDDFPQDVDNNGDIKSDDEEITIEVDLKHPIHEVENTGNVTTGNNTNPEDQLNVKELEVEVPKLEEEKKLPRGLKKVTRNGPKCSVKKIRGKNQAAVNKKRTQPRLKNGSQDRAKSKPKQLVAKKLTGVTKRRPQPKKRLEKLKKLLDDGTDTRVHRNVFLSFATQVQTKDSLTYSCAKCLGSYQTKKDLIEHINLQHQSRFNCEECGKVFKFECLLKIHMEKHIKIEYVCRYCGKNLCSKHSLAMHESMHTNPEPILQCDYCKKKFAHKCSLKKHILTMHCNVQEHLCEVCGWSFKQKSNLQAHVRVVHLQQRPFECMICHKTYSAKKHLKSHINTTHSENPKPYQCDICYKSFSCPKSLKLHRLRHEGRFACRYCPEIFDNRDVYQEHFERHIQRLKASESHACQICGKVVLSKYNLNRHMEIHSGIKRFSCEICNIRFTQKAQLVRHNKRKHDETVNREKTKCEICKRFIINMEKHIKSHQEENRIYYCDVCNKSYPSNNTLTRHRNQKHFGHTFNCEICAKTYMKKKALENHKMKVHQIKKEVVETSAKSEDIEITAKSEDDKTTPKSEDIEISKDFLQIG